MKRKRRTSQEVTDQMFEELNKKGDLVLIATSAENWCYEYSMCCNSVKKDQVEEDDDDDLYIDIHLYRSLSKKGLCFYHEATIYRHGVDYNLFRFSFNDLEDFVEDDVRYIPDLYKAEQRKRKLKKVFAH